MCVVLKGGLDEMGKFQLASLCFQHGSDVCSLMHVMCAKVTCELITQLELKWEQAQALWKCEVSAYSEQLPVDEGGSSH